MTTEAYDKVLQIIKELRPVQNNILFVNKPHSFFLDCVEREVLKLKETTNVAIPTTSQPEGQGKQNPEIQPRQP